MEFQNKVAIITGGANGIGRCIAEEFLKAGATTIIIDKTETTSEILMNAPLQRYFFFQGDIAEESVITEFAETVIKRFGRVDILINNACLSRGGILSGCEWEDFNYVLRIGVTAPYMLCRLFMSYMNHASIVNLSSTRASMSQSDTESYTAAKGGIAALTHSLSVSLAGKARVNSISPGWIDTGAWQQETHYKPAYTEADIYQHPAGKVGEPQDIASMVLFLCSEKASFITGENITIDGGISKQMVYSDDNGWSFSVR